MARVINILGVTGSVGRQAAEIVRGNPRLYKIGALTAHSNAEELARTAVQLRASLAAIADKAAYKRLKLLLEGSGIECSDEPAAAAATLPADVVLVASGGVGGLELIIKALEYQEKVVAVANKEAFLLAGRLVMEAARRSKALLLPVDSEHNAIYRLSEGGKGLRKVILTASGGPFFGFSEAELEKVTPEQALAHPNWQMGAKISIDSATLMNKGMEIIEASYLFGLRDEDIEVLVERNSLVHAVLEFNDGSHAASVGKASMKTPISFAFMHPHCPQSVVEPLDFSKLDLQFVPPDEETFACLGLARHAFRMGESATAVLEGANRVAVREFLGERLPFLRIAEIVREVLEKANDLTKPLNDMEQALARNRQAVREAESLLEKVRA